MPIYEFKCGSCGTINEFLMSIRDNTPEICTSCGAKGSLQKIISRNNFVLKGQGWYETDFKEPANKKEEKKKETPKNVPSKTKENVNPSESTSQKGVSKDSSSSKKAS